jgi:hypothetical protein
MCDVKCGFKDKCVSYPNKCGSCTNNESKRDYYSPYYPYIPNYPWYYPYYVTTVSTCTTTTNDCYKQKE